MLDGRAVVITGAGSGIGRATSQLFAAEGALVVCADLRQGWVDETVRSIEVAGGTAVSVTCDVTEQDQVDSVVSRAVAEFGALDVMFNNAGIGSPRPGQLLDEVTDEEFDNLLSVNCRGVFHGCKAAVRQFRRQDGGGVIVNTGSIAGMIAWGGVAYGATKALVIQLTRALAIEVAADKIRVNCICPGGIKTNLGVPESEAFKPISEAELAALSAMHPLGELLTVEDCARAALFLASDLSSNITGVPLPVDGGYLAK
jgi:NAD(P)-dependent dehydrogenase (short-subunit alcohol dehydrogenase family)